MHTRCQEINYIPCSMGAPHYPNGAAHFKFVPQNDNITSFVSTNWSLMEKLLKLRKYNLTARNIWPYFAVYYNFAKWRIHQLGQVKRSWMVSLIFTTRLSSLFYSWIRAHFAQFSQGGVPFLTDFESFIEQKNITKYNG